MHIHTANSLRYKAICYLATGYVPGNVSGMRVVLYCRTNKAPTKHHNGTIYKTYSMCQCHFDLHNCICLLIVNAYQ